MCEKTFIGFGKRKELENIFIEWTKRNEAANTAFNVITFLETYNLLNRENVSKFLEEKKNENKF